MDKSDISKQVISIVAKHFDIDQNKVSNDTNFSKDLDADSIDFVELIMSMQDKFHINISDKDIHKIQTVGQTIDYINNHMNK